MKLLREHLLAIADETSYIGKAHAQSMRERKGMPTAEPDEVLLDPAEIIRRYNEGRKQPLPDPTPEQGNHYEQPRPRARLGFTSVRGI